MSTTTKLPVPIKEMTREQKNEYHRLKNKEYRERNREKYNESVRKSIAKKNDRINHELAELKRLREAIEILKNKN